MFVWEATYDNTWTKVGEGVEITGSYLNRWTHIAFVYGDGFAQLFVDGQLIDEKDSTHDFSRMNEQNLYIGKFSDYWFPFNGLIDEVRIYNRALDIDEVKSLANCGNNQ